MAMAAAAILIGPLTLRPPSASERAVADRAAGRRRWPGVRAGRRRDELRGLLYKLRMTNVFGALL